MSPIESQCQPFYETIKLQIIVSNWKSTLDCMESPLRFGFLELDLDRNIS